MRNAEKRKLNISTTTLIVLVIVTVFTSLYMRGLNTGIPLYYDSLDYSATLGGTFVAVFTLAAMAMRMVGGQLTDHFSHYKVLLFSLVIMLVGSAIPLLSNNIPLAMVSRVLQGGSFAVATNVMTVAVIGSSTKAHIGRRLGIKGAGNSLGTMFGALVSTGLLDSIGYEGFYGFYAALMVITIVAVLLLKKRHAISMDEDDGIVSQSVESGKTVADDSEKDAQAPATSGEAVASKTVASKTIAVPVKDTVRGSGRETYDETTSSGKTSSRGKASKSKQAFREFIAPFLRKDAMPFMAISFARRIPKGFCAAFILIFAKYASIAGGPAFFVAAGAATLLCRLLGGKVFDSDKTWLLLPLQSVQIIGFIVFVISPNIVTLVAAGIGYGISVGTTSPLIKALVAKSTPKEHWGAINGELFFFADIGKSIAAFCGGLLVDALTKSYIPELALIFAIVSSVITAAALLVGCHLWAHNR